MTALALGCAPIGNLFSDVDADEATATIAAALEAGIRYFDTAPLYGHGLSEQRLGEGLRAAGVARDDVVISTKVGRLLVEGTDVNTVFTSVPPVRPEFDFSADGVRRSLDASLERLGLDRVDIVLVHDPEDHLEQARDEAIPTLCALRDEGVIGAVGAGMNFVEPLDHLVERTDLDCIILAGRYTLLDRSAAVALLPRCIERQV